MLSERNLIANQEGFIQLVHFDSNDRMVLALPLFHSYGLIIALTNLLYGGALTLVPKFSPKQILHAMQAEKVTILPLVPTLFTVILTMAQKEMPATPGGRPFESLRFCVSGGASLPAKLLEQIEAVLHTFVVEGYGLTETSPVVALNDPNTGSIPYSVGKALPNVTVENHPGRRVTMRNRGRRRDSG